MNERWLPRSEGAAKLSRTTLCHDGKSRVLQNYKNGKDISIIALWIDIAKKKNYAVYGVNESGKAQRNATLWRSSHYPVDRYESVSKS